MRPTCLVAFVACLVVGARSQSAGCGKESPQLPGTSASFWVEWDGAWYEHWLTIPLTYENKVPVPFMLYHHGWGGSSYTCGNICDTYAPKFGFAAVALQGVGADTPSGASWNGAGSTGSPGPRGATCLDTTTNYCYDDCKGGCSDNCWWTTCSDSVGFVEATLDAIEAAFCVNTSAVWATGGSNGGIFVYELASDARMAGRLAGIAPVTGLPHKGFLQPARGLHYISMLGATDGTVPPFSAGDTATDEPDISVTTSYSPGGWYFHTARATSDAWADANDCGKREPTSDWRIGEQGEATGGPLDCTARRAPRGADVVECIFPAGHVSYLEAQWIVILDFMRSHSRLLDFASKSSSL